MGYGEQYSDAQYGVTIEKNIPLSISGTGTATASAAVVSVTDAAKFELFTRCKLLAMKANVVTASPIPTATLLLMNDTDQLGDIAIGTSTALTEVDGTMTAAECADIDANTELQVDFTGTATVSAGVVTIGPVMLSLLYQNLFA